MKLTKIALKPYAQYKIKDMIYKEIKSLSDESYENPYFQDRRWYDTAWIIHKRVKEAYENTKQEIYDLVDKMAAEYNATEEQKQEILNRIVFKETITPDRKPGLDVQFKEKE